MHHGATHNHCCPDFHGGTHSNHCGPDFHGGTHSHGGTHTYECHTIYVLNNCLRRRSIELFPLFLPVGAVRRGEHPQGADEDPSAQVLLALMAVPQVKEGHVPRGPHDGGGMAGRDPVAGNVVRCVGWDRCGPVQGTPDAAGDADCKYEVPDDETFVVVTCACCRRLVWICILSIHVCLIVVSWLPFPACLSCFPFRFSCCVAIAMLHLLKRNHDFTHRAKRASRAEPAAGDTRGRTGCWRDSSRRPGRGSA